MFGRKLDSRGFILIETLILAMLVSVGAMIVMRGFHSAQRISRETAIKNAAIHFANARLAEAQYNANNLAAMVSSSSERLENMLGGEGDEGLTVEFDIKTSVGGAEVTVEVTPRVNNVELNGLKVIAKRKVFKLSSTEGST